MFWKYLFKNIKNKAIQYLIIFICQLVLLVIAIAANGIMLNTIVEGTNAEYMARNFDFRFNKAISTHELRDRFDEFFSKCPYEINRIDMIVKVEDAPESKYYYYPKWLEVFPDYQAMTNRMKEYFGLSDTQIFTEQQYQNCEKVVLLTSDPGLYMDEESNDVFPIEYRYTDSDHILIGDEEYLILGNTSAVAECIIPFGSEPDEMTTSYVYFETENILTENQISEVHDLFVGIFGEDNISSTVLPQIRDLLDLRKNTANIVLTALMLVLVIFNTTLIFKQMIEGRKRDFAIYNFCGFSKKTCIVYGGTELILISLISSIASCFVFDLPVKPILSSYYSTISVMYTMGYYLIIILAYIVFSILMFVIYIAPIIKKNTSEQLRSI